MQNVINTRSNHWVLKWRPALQYPMWKSLDILYFSSGGHCLCMYMRIAMLLVAAT